MIRFATSLKLFFILIIISVLTISFAQPQKNFIKYFQQNNPVELKAFIESADNLSEKDKYGCTLLSYALANRDHEIADKIIEKLQDKKELYQTAIWAIELRDYKALDYLSGKINLKNIRDKQDRTYLHYLGLKLKSATELIKHNKLLIAKILLNRLDFHHVLRQAGEENKTKNSSDDKIKEITSSNVIPDKVKANKNEDITSESKTTPVEKVLPIITDPNAIPANNLQTEYGFTALHYAVLNNSERLVKVLLEKKADRNLKDSFNLTPLEWAKCLHFKNVIKLFDNKLEHEVQILKGSDIRNLERNILHLLLESKIEINHKDNNGLTALHYAVKGRNHDLVKDLLEKGANMNAVAVYKAPENNQVNLHEIVKYAKPADYNFKLICTDINIKNPASDNRSYYKVIIDKEDSGRTSIALESQTKEFKSSLSINKHLIRIEKYELNKKKKRYNKLNNIDQPKPNYFYVDVPEDRIVVLKVVNDHAGRKAEYLVEFERE
jgi:ankyrin repeat protein